MTSTTLAVGSPNPFSPPAQAVDQGQPGGGGSLTNASVPPGDSLVLSMDAWLLAKGQGDGAFQSGLEGLGRLIHSGNLEGARQAYSTLSALLQGRPVSSSEEAFLARDFGSLGQALASGDLTATRSAWSAMGADLEAHKPQPHPSPSPIFAVGAYLQQSARARS